MKTLGFLFSFAIGLAVDVYAGQQPPPRVTGEEESSLTQGVAVGGASTEQVPKTEDAAWRVLLTDLGGNEADTVSRHQTRRILASCGLTSPDEADIVYWHRLAVLEFSS